MKTPDEKFEAAQQSASEAINSLAEAIIAIRKIVTLSIQQRTDLTQEARTHIECAQHFLEDGVVANLFEQNVKEHATLSVKAIIDHGVEVECRKWHENRAADRGCVSRLVGLLSFPKAV